jgi:hypothetical protein
MKKPATAMLLIVPLVLAVLLVLILFLLKKDDAQPFVYSPF